MAFPFGQLIHSATSSSAESFDDITFPVGVIVDRLGIQAEPNAAFKINGETFHIGRTGLFEVELLINSLKVQSNKLFTIDYHYIGG